MLQETHNLDLVTVVTVVDTQSKYYEYVFIKHSTIRIYILHMNVAVKIFFVLTV